MKEQNDPPGAVVWILREVPATILDEASGEVISADVKGVTARLEPSGQDAMNPAARLKTERTPRGVSNADGTAITWEAARMNV